MTSPIDLLREAEAYLSALHEHAARHDVLGAELGCCGCQLRERITAMLADLDSHPGVDPMTDRPADDRRQRIAEALARYEWNGGLSGYVSPSAHHYGEADAVLAALHAPADRAAVYRDAWHSARRRARVLSDELTRRAPLLGEYATEIERLREQLAEARGAAELADRNTQTVARERDSYRQAWKDEQQRRVKVETIAKQPADRAAAPRMADAAQRGEKRCTCADAGTAFAPAGHYADCPQADEAQQGGDPVTSAELLATAADRLWHVDPNGTITAVASFAVLCVREPLARWLRSAAASASQTDPDPAALDLARILLRGDR